MHNENLDHWNGWACNVGKDRIYIDANLDVYGGECKNDRLGNILTEWHILTDATICNRLRCTGCTDDLIQHKRETR